MRHLLDPMDLSVQETEDVLNLAAHIMNHKELYREVCKYKKLATLFFEPSTRTRLSFESAMLELGGTVIGFSSADSSSAAKGESVADTIRAISCFADIAAMRHPKDGSAYVAALNSTIPVINAGDGGHHHPTQTLTDLMTIRSEKGRLDNLTIGMCGDLKFGRTVHSLVHAMCRYENVRFIFISPKELQIPNYIKDELSERGYPYLETQSMEEAMPQLDILYMTRIQRERFVDKEEYLRLKDSYILDLKKLETAKADLAVLHPLPRVNEISVKVDSDPRALYFKQILYGKYARMALICRLLEIETPYKGSFASKKLFIPANVQRNTMRCSNTRCITTVEQELDQAFVPVNAWSHKCLYCDTIMGQ